MRIRGSIERLYYLSKTTPKGRAYQTAFPRKADAVAAARSWVKRGAKDVHIRYGYLSDAPSDRIWSKKFREVAF